MLRQDFQAELFRLPPGHKQNCSRAIRNLAGVTAGRPTLAPLRECGLDPRESLLLRSVPDAVVFGEYSGRALSRCWIIHECGERHDL